MTWDKFQWDKFSKLLNKADNLTNTTLLDTYGWIIFQNKKKYVNVTKCHIIVNDNGLIYCYLGYKFLICCCY